MKIAERWWQTRSLSDGVTHLYEPHVHPLIRCNVWHVRGRDRDLVVDTGVGASAIGPEIAALSDRPVVAVATHYHWDHVGGLHEFDERVMHGLEAELMDPYGGFATLLRSDFGEVELGFMETMGYPLEDEVLIDALPEPGYDPAAYRVLPAAPTRIVEDGDAIDLGDRRFEIMHLPGHSPGSIGLFEDRTRTLFSGDAIYDGPLLDALPESDVGAYVQTMKRLRDVPADVVHGGHEESFGRARLIEIVDAYLEARA